jgi:hypothetical protein
MQVADVDRYRPGCYHRSPSRARATRAIQPVGAWRSQVARIVRDDEVGGSNPLAPTSTKSSLLAAALPRSHACSARGCTATTSDPHRSRRSAVRRESIVWCLQWRGAFRQNRWPQPSATGVDHDVAWPPPRRGDRRDSASVRALDPSSRRSPRRLAIPSGLPPTASQYDDLRHLWFALGRQLRIRLSRARRP